MKYTFITTFCWADGTAQWDVTPFEAESTEEVISKITELIDSDSDAASSEDFYIESEWVDDVPGLYFEYHVERRHYYLHDEKDKMLKELRQELDEFFKEG